jgi:hypothetical protein
MAAEPVARAIESPAAPCALAPFALERRRRGARWLTPVVVVIALSVLGLAGCASLGPATATPDASGQLVWDCGWRVMP